MNSDEIKNLISMREVVRKYGIKMRNGMICCPFHQEKNPSMKIYKDSYNCFCCHEHGDVFTFVMKMEKCDFKTAFTILGGTYDNDKKTLRCALKRVEQAQKERAVAKERERKKNIREADLYRLSYRNNMANKIAYKELTDKEIPGSEAFWEYLDKYHISVQKELNMIGGVNSC